MRIVSYLLDGKASYGVIDPSTGIEAYLDASVIDIPTHVAGAPGEVHAFLAELECFRAPIEAVDYALGVAFSDLELLAVIPDPRNIIAVGVNYVDHAAETGDSVPPFPLIFSKFTSSIAAHGSEIRIPGACTEPDYEAELGLVIARAASNVTKEEALGYVGGYFTFNDVSARDYQNRTSQWTQGKGFPTFAPTGPYLVTADEFGPPEGRRIQLAIGDEILQDANTSDMVFDVASIVSYVSTVCDLRPGDVIATGTPSGVGVARVPQRFLRDGDVVTVAIDGLPSLVNTVGSHG